MSKRAMTVIVDCEDETCGKCHLERQTNEFTFMCVEYGMSLENDFGELGMSKRCPACLTAESKAFSRAGG